MPPSNSAIIRAQSNAVSSKFAQRILPAAVYPVSSPSLHLNQTSAIAPKLPLTIAHPLPPQSRSPAWFDSSFPYFEPSNPQKPEDRRRLRLGKSNSLSQIFNRREPQLTAVSSFAHPPRATPYIAPKSPSARDSLAPDFPPPIPLDSPIPPQGNGQDRIYSGAMDVPARVEQSPHNR